MKKVFLLLALLMGISIHSMAQNYTEVVYLKNGSIIRGIIIEQVPNSSLKIQTADGNTFAYAMDEVLKITKETRDTEKKNKAMRNATLRGYKGFVETGFIFDVSDNNANHFEVSTTHGYQFNNYLFVGGGMGVNAYTDVNSCSVPIFAAFRANFTKKKTTPFADIRSGYLMGDDLYGAFVSVGLGVRFALAKKMAINLKLEYLYQGFDYDDYDSGYNSYYNGTYYDYNSTVDTNGFGLKLGFEF